MELWYWFPDEITANLGRLRSISNAVTFYLLKECVKRLAGKLGVGECQWGMGNREWGVNTNFPFYLI